MCGIFGILSSALPENGIIKNALDSIRHRGPDDEGYILVNSRGNTSLVASGSDTCPELIDEYTDILDADLKRYDILLAHRRLSVIDLSCRAHQPMTYANGDACITYNGEIFNYRELKTELRLLGCRFGSDSDTEVILAAYNKWGKRCVDRFNGQWAFCIYDRRRRELFCSRDRFGIKPFYYWFDGRNFAFASEIKSLLTLPFIRGEISRTLIPNFIIFYELDTSAETLYKGIFQLPPSHNLIFDVEGKDLRVEKYYDLNYLDETGDYNHRKALRYADDIRDLLIDSVKIRLISDVSVGTCLSGGLDSSSIVVIINKLLKEGGISRDQIGETQKTFTASYDDPAVDERVHAGRIITHTNVDPHFSYPKAEGLWEELDRFLYHQDGPCPSTTFYAGWDVMRLASRYVKVVLNGQGGDELLGGYLHYEILYLADMIRTGRYGDLLAALAVMGYRHGPARAFLKGAFGSCLAMAPVALKLFLFKEWYRTPYSAVKRLMNEPLPIDEHLARMIDNMKSLNHFLITDTGMRYLPQLLHYDDRNGAAFSIENRVPFLDHRLVEYINGIPSIYKLYRGWSKWLLRLAMRDLLPEKILWRKDKLGFPTPVKAWLTHSISPVPGLMKRYGLREYGHLAWRVFLADRLMNHADLIGPHNRISENRTGQQ
jgi:asparagine synthase (glutamine-hydrolysing)